LLQPRFGLREPCARPDQHVMGECAEQRQHGLRGGTLLPPAVNADALLVLADLDLDGAGRWS
jgi:hypothetical protein